MLKPASCSCVLSYNGVPEGSLYATYQLSGHCVKIKTHTNRCFDQGEMRRRVLGMANVPSSLLQRNHDAAQAVSNLPKP